ncbi:phage tail sheath C-terminal domain-containing protein [uncultured Arcticibacterium sp.]|uniref:phage tail sheath family protein n=1 Tax=uncultured Arcticibacterium sp. TaxID=2173042 RepID=UPI0030F5E59A
MNLSTIKTPGVYVNEVNAFGNSVVPIATAVPAFIGYTPQATYEGKSYSNVATKITSFADFKAIFCLPNPPPPADPAKQYNPEYYLVAEASQPTKDNYIKIGTAFYSILPDPNTVYYLYNSIKLFYDNGGGDAYIVSVGSYGKPSGSPATLGEQIVNSNIQLNQLTNGLALLKQELEPTMYICPEATLLSVDNNASLMKAMLSQASEMQTTVCIFDVIGGRNPDPINYMDAIATFRDGTGANSLGYGTAYYPFVGTTVMQSSDIDYTNLFGGDITQLQAILSSSNNPNATIDTIIANIQNPPGGEALAVSQYNNSLLSASTTYGTIIATVLKEANTLPPSGGMAGVITNTDNQVGPWQSPANTSMIDVISLPINLTDTQQADLNVDAISGKSINAIRNFNRLGILIWGARTLDGNSQDWRYLSVRRTMIFLEQSCKLATNAYVFEPNTKNTWEAVKAMIGSFLNNVWTQGGLQGASASDAFSVECGLGSTMTTEDILNGFMNVSVKVAVVRPAEFIVFTIQQEMATSS